MLNKRGWIIFYIVFLWFGGINFCAATWAQSIQRPAIIGISYITFQVKDLASTVQFYQEFLGYKKTTINTSHAENTKQIAFIVNDRQQIKIHAGLPPGQDERLLEIAFQITNAEAMRLYLLGKGIKTPAAVSKVPEGISFVITDADNHLIRFIQYSKAYWKSRNYKRKPEESAVSNRILHVGITVSEVNAADKLYRDILGFSEIWRGGRPDSVTNWINMRVPEGTDYVEYMLISGPVTQQQLGVLHHVALQVPDMQKALDKLRKRIPNSGSSNIEAPRVGRNNKWQLNLFDPDGTRVELMEPFTMR